MKIFILSIFTVFVTIFTLGCTKESVNTLVYPTTFTFNTPILENRSVYRIDSTIVLNTATQKKDTLWKFSLLTEEKLGTFDRPNAEITDTINKMLVSDLQNGFLSKITLLNSKQAELEYSYLDTMTQNFVYIKTDTVQYDQNGNYIFGNAYLNNDSREIFLCREFILAKKVDMNTSISKYFTNSCVGNSLSSIKNFVANNPDVKYDTAAVELVSVIYSNYK